jgi:hypothetical protein
LQDIKARDQYHAKIEAELAAKKQAVEQVTQRVSPALTRLSVVLTYFLYSTTSTTRNERSDITYLRPVKKPRLQQSLPTRSATLIRLPAMTG